MANDRPPFNPPADLLLAMAEICAKYGHEWRNCFEPGKGPVTVCVRCGWQQVRKDDRHA